jgi:hypothetical protein
MAKILARQLLPRYYTLQAVKIMRPDEGDPVKSDETKSAMEITPSIINKYWE